MCPDDTAPDGAVRIPLRAKDGSVRAYAIVDAADAEWANQWRWALCSGGYAGRSVVGKSASTGKKANLTVLLHRELLGLKAGSEFDGDHIDRDRLNNRRSNLRAIPSTRFGSPNGQNLTSHRDASSKFRGVFWNKRDRTWVANVRRGRKSVFYKHCATEEEAAQAAREARLRLLPYAVD